MAELKKNQMNQIMFPMVDRTGFATLESALGTDSDFNSKATKTFFGLNHGGSVAFTSGAISKLATTVRSGLYALTLKASECNYDMLTVRITHPSCADQLLLFQTVTNDDSDMYSMLSDLMSDFQSRVPKLVANNSQLSDLHSDLRSFLVVMSGIQSDILSAVSDLQSDFQSRVPKLVATNSQLSDLHSDLRSFLVVMSGIQSDILSSVSDLQSDFQSRVPKRVATDSQLSDVHSDLRSQIGGITASVSASDIIDIASAVDAILASRLSDILSAAVQTNSRALVIQSTASDIYSLASDLQSDFQSRVPKRVATDSQLSDVQSDLRSLIIAGVGVTLSGMSDIASMVWSEKYTAASNVKASTFGSLARLNMSRISDIYSLASDLQSDFQSRVPKLVATNSQVSDLASDLRSFLVVMSGVQSDIYSALSDFQSDFGSRVPKRVATDSQLSDVHSDLASKIAGITASVSASDISDIASAVRAILIRDLSDIHSAATAGASRALLNQSRISDLQSTVSDFYSDFQSRVPKRVATDSQLSDVHSDLASKIAGIVASVSASDISDIASAVNDILASRLSDILSAAVQANSRVLVTQSLASDVYSLVSDFYSDFQSRVPKRVATDSQLSDVQSDLRSQIAGITASVSASD